jgi:transposase
MTPRRQDDPKAAALRTAGALHPRPQKVRDEAFAGEHEFFDPRDHVQVKYEMLRRHRVEGRPVSHVAQAFGISRQAFYVADQALQQQGIPGLLPRHRGPRRNHKCTEDILDFVERWRAGRDVQGQETLALAVRRRFGITVHPRSLDRALARRKKKTHDHQVISLTPQIADRLYLLEQYEALRREALEADWGERGHGMALFLTRGMTAWVAAVEALAPAASKPQHDAAKDAAQSPQPKLAFSFRAELTAVLAGIVLACSGAEEEAVR